MTDSKPAQRRTSGHRTAVVAVALSALALGACSTAAVMGRSETTATRPEQEIAGPLSGEALAQRKIEMRRSAKDLVHFGATVETMRLRRDRGRGDFQEFMDRFLADRVDPLFHGTESTDDPELAVLDAELRLMKAELLIETKDFWSAGDIIDSVESRYGGRRSMLVRFPVGQQSTIAASIDYLRERNKGAPGNWSAATTGH
ncbi:MAG: hypothetical protein ACQGVK_25095 [Myxococcota bacterium]